jgi:ribosome-associated protein
MDKISDLKNIVINTLDTNKAEDIITIDLKIRVQWLII